MNAVDTNVLIYADDPRDVQKQRIATELVRSLEDGVLLWQVACEYLSVVRRMRSTGPGLAEGHRRIQNLRRMWHFAEPEAPVMDLAVSILGRYSLSFWDSLVVAGSLHAGAEQLYTEDFDAYPKIDTLEIATRSEISTDRRVNHGDD